MLTRRSFLARLAAVAIAPIIARLSNSPREFTLKRRILGNAEMLRAMRMTGSVNSQRFRGYAPGTVLLACISSARPRGKDGWDVKYEFIFRRDTFAERFIRHGASSSPFEHCMLYPMADLRELSGLA